VLFGQSGVILATLRIVKLSPTLTTWLFRKACTTRKPSDLVPACHSAHTPRAALPPGRRAGLLLAPNWQRPSARSRHTDFTTRLPHSCVRLRKVVSSWWN